MVSLSALHRDNPDNPHITMSYNEAQWEDSHSQKVRNMGEQNALSSQKKEFDQNNC